MNTLSPDIFQLILSYISDSDLFYLCQTNENISEFCDFAYRALLKGYIKNLDEFETEKVWPKNKASERYLQLLSKVDCIQGSEKYIKNWKIICSFRAGKQGDIKLINYFLNKGCDINEALKGASEGGYIDAVKYLIDEKGATNFNEALWGAAEGGNLDIVKYLVSQGAEYLNYAIVLASKSGHIDIVKYLRSKGAFSLNAALMSACDGGHIDIVKYLIAEGATDLCGSIHISMSKGHTDIANYLKSLLN